MELKDTVVPRGSSLCLHPSWTQHISPDRLSDFVEIVTKRKERRMGNFTCKFIDHRKDGFHHGMHPGSWEGGECIRFTIEIHGKISVSNMEEGSEDYNCEFWLLREGDTSNVESGGKITWHLKCNISYDGRQGQEGYVVIVHVGQQEEIKIYFRTEKEAQTFLYAIKRWQNKLLTKLSEVSSGTDSSDEGDELDDAKGDVAGVVQ